jgi:hypothetical protein
VTAEQLRPGAKIAAAHEAAHAVVAVHLGDGLRVIESSGQLSKPTFPF